MRKFSKIAPALLLIGAMLLSLFSTYVFAETAVVGGTGYDSAADVVYVTSNGYIANWGARDEDCVFLSTYAQNFYTGNSTYSVMSQNAGGTTQSNADSSALYGALHDVMANAHTFYTYYDGSQNVRDFYKYADCVKSDLTQVSLLYLGTMETSEWNSGSVWNQEHMWPKSKLTSSEQIGDIMQLRPADPSENSSRGNTAYGISESYYDPDKNGQSIRGDCARLVLYMYVRWETADTMWGTDGAIENLDVLLEWMEEDPVDTWEMGRNDAVQSITGTRNVFVDYPEYAWLLFGREVPANMVTPSGIAGGNDTSTETTTTATTTVPATESETEALAPDSGNTEIVTETATLTFDSTDKRTAFSTTQQVWEENGITVTNDKGAGSNVADYSNPVRFYKNSTVTVEAGDSITEIVFNCNTAAYATALASSIGADTTADGKAVTVTFAEAVESYSVVLSGGQVRMDSVTVTVQSVVITTEPEPEPPATEAPTTEPETESATESETEAADPVNAELNIEKCNISLRDSTVIKYGIKAGSYDPQAIKILIWTESDAAGYTSQSDYVLGTQSQTITYVGQQLIGGVTYYVYDLMGVSAKQMTDIFYARAYVEGEDSISYGSVKQFSVAQYVHDVQATGSTELLELLGNMLTYGASAQTYFGYRTDWLATAEAYKITVVGGTLADGTAEGFYKAETLVTLTAPETNGTLAFSHWENSAGESVSTSRIMEISISSDGTYTAVYS